MGAILSRSQCVKLLYVRYLFQICLDNGILHVAMACGVESARKREIEWLVKFHATLNQDHNLSNYLSSPLLSSFGSQDPYVIYCKHGIANVCFKRAMVKVFALL